MRAEDTKRSNSNPKAKACKWACLPDRRSDKAEQDLMTQGKVDLLGLTESFRIDRNARRASKESPLRAKSAMTEFHEETLVLSTYLLNHSLRFGMDEAAENLWCLHILIKKELVFGTFILRFRLWHHDFCPPPVWLCINTRER